MTQTLQPSLLEQKLYWENRWDRVRVPNEWSHRRGSAVLKLLRDLKLRDPKLLDLGCGTGWFAEEAVTIGSVTAIDLSETAIEIARKAVPQAKFIAGNVYTLPLPEQHFDVVISMQVLSHVEDQAKYLSRAAQLVKPGGYFILTTDNKFAVRRMDNEANPSAHIEDYLTRGQLFGLLARDFRVLQCKSMIVGAYRGWLRIINSSRLNALLGFLLSHERLEVLKERAGLGNTWVILAKKER